ncbi:MAG: thiol reductant ABC exporter subunit CydD, partial [Vallitaleaceae bacterium]|nr:thiol reductant ABC exporter subunit CydD [Vallitaleaceae bacterium]
MFDRRLFGELKTMRAFWFKVTATAIVVVTLTILQGQKLSWLINAIIIEKKDVPSLGGVFLFLALIMLAKAVISFALERYNRFCGIKIKENIRKRLTARFIELGPIHLKSEKAGSLASITHEGVDNLEPYYSEFIPQLVLVMASTPLVLIVVLATDWISGLIMLFTLPFIPVFMILIGKTASYVNKKQWKTLQQMSGHFLDVIRGLSTLRLFNRLKKQAEIVKEVNEAFRGNTMKVLRISFLSALVLELVAT